jgi:hypothetical protein
MQMAVPESKWGRRRFSRSPWLAIWSLALGILIFAATTIGGNLRGGLVSLVPFVAFAAVFYFGARNETIAGLTAPARDERWAMINRGARTVAGTLVILIVIGGWLYELASGRDGSPYVEMIGAGAIAYFVAALWLRFRS